MRLIKDMQRLATAILGMLVALLLLVISVPSPAHAQGKLQNLEELDILVEAAMGAAIGEPGGARTKVDRRLKLKQCPEAPTVSGTVMGAASVKCEALGWRIRVPLIAIASSSNSYNAQSTRDNQAQYGAGEDVVKRGEPILLTVKRPSFTLTRVMIADKNGKVGDVIPVRAEPRGNPIFVRITAPGQATIL